MQSDFDFLIIVLENVRGRGSLRGLGIGNCHSRTFLDAIMKIFFVSRFFRWKARRLHCYRGKMENVT